MTLRLLGAGFGRTGTLSTKVALEILGLGPCHHMQEIRENPSLLEDWNRAARGEAMDWNKVFSGYVSQIDWPGSGYWRELAAFFPDAKVVLNYREPEDWYRSLEKTIIPSAAVGRKADANPHTRAMADMVYQLVHQKIFKGRIEDRDFAIQVYLDHIREVKAALPPQRLLVYDVRDGWSPLCQFLGVAVPAQDFPHKNTQEEFIKNRSFLRGLGTDPDPS